MQLSKRGLFNEKGDIETSKRRVINGNTTNLNDFNNLKYSWTSDWYRQAMNNFWIPEEINLSQDVKDYRELDKAEKTAYDKILSFLIYLDSLQTAQIPKLQSYVTANEINLAFQSRVTKSPFTLNLIPTSWTQFVLQKREKKSSTNTRMTKSS